MIRFLFIMLIVVIDDLAHELVAAFNTTSDLVRYRLKWIVRDKLLVIWRGRAR